MLLMPATFAANHRPSLPLPPLPLPPGRHHLHCHHCGQTCRCSLPKKEATAAAPPVYQGQQQRENIYKSRQLDLFNLSTVSREFSDYQVVSLKKKCTFFVMYILVDASLYVFGSCHVIKKHSTLTPMWNFCNYLAAKKRFLASVYS
jgi:hypothetical protein